MHSISQSFEEDEQYNTKLDAKIK